MIHYNSERVLSPTHTRRSKQYEKLKRLDKDENTQHYYTQCLTIISYDIRNKTPKLPIINLRVGVFIMDIRLLLPLWHHVDGTMFAPA